jgi:hypothetical protein
MHYTSNTVFFDSSIPDVNLALRVFIAYEDMSAGKRAKETCDVLAENLGVDWELETDLASFKSLSVPRLQSIAAVEASKANIIIVACRNGQPPPEVKQWIRVVLSYGLGPMALVALLAGPRMGAADGDTAKTYLAKAAKLGHMQFFSRLESTPRGQWDWNGRAGFDLGQLGKRMCV